MGNSVPSDNLADLKVNMETVDEFVSSNSSTTTTRPTPTDPAGKTVRTISGINNEAQVSLDAAELAATDSAAALGITVANRNESTAALGATESNRDDSAVALGVTESNRDDSAAALGITVANRNESTAALGVTESNRDDSETAKNTAEAAAGDAIISKDSAAAYATDSEDSANLASAYTDISASNANFEGNWADLSGAYNIPTSVYEDNKYWQLLSDTLDIATIQPGVSNQWALIRGSSDSIQFDTAIDFINNVSTAPLVDDIVEFLGFAAKGDGGAKWRFNGITGQTPSQTPSQLGDALLNDLSGNQWALVADKEFRIETLGAIGGGADDTLAVIAACNYSRNNDVLFVHVNKDLIVTSDEPTKASAIFIGSGSIEGMYRRDVFPANAQSFAFFDTLSNGQLRQFRLVDSPKVVAMGDSTWTIAPQTMSHQDTVWQMLTKKLSQQYPEKDIAYVNRAIGGTTWSHADSVPTSFPSWYTNPSSDWLTYIEAEQPDIIILGFGMNDQYQFDGSKMRSVVDKINAFAKIPDIIIATNLVPSLGSPSPTYHSQEKQEGRDFVAGFERTFAISNGYPLLDFNRCLNIVRDGRDIFQSSMVRQQTNSTDNITVGGKFIAPDECHDYSAVVRVTGTQQEILDMFLSTNGTMSFQLGYEADDTVFVFEDNGFVRLAFYSADNGVPYNALTTDLPIPTNDFYMRVEKSANKFLISISSSESDESTYEYEGLITHGGLFVPTIGYYLQTDGFATTITYSKGINKKFLPSVLDSDIWGEPIFPPIGQFPNGGNGVNHPTSFGCSAVYAPVINSADFTRPYYSINKDIVLTTGVIATFPAMAVISDSVVALKGSLFTDGNVQICVLPEVSRPFHTDLRVVAASITSGVWGTTLIEISTTGTVAILDAVPDLVQLDGLSYSIHQA